MTIPPLLVTTIPTPAYPFSIRSPFRYSKQIIYLIRQSAKAQELDPTKVLAITSSFDSRQVITQEQISYSPCILR